MPRKPRGSTRRQKVDDVLGKVRKHVDAGTYLDTRHATDRKSERQITLLEVLHVLKNGYHERRKDEFKEEFQAWNYAIRGKTVDGRPLRVAVAFVEPDMLIITAIDLDVRG